MKIGDTVRLINYRKHGVGQIVQIEKMPNCDAPYYVHFFLGWDNAHSENELELMTETNAMLWQLENL